MQVRISDLLDGLEDSSVAVSSDVVSAEKIKELTMSQLKTENPGRFHRSTRRVLTLALAAALLLSLTVAAYAAASRISDPLTAERVAQQEIERWKELGLLSPDVHFDGPAEEIIEVQERIGGTGWFGRIFPHHFDVRWYFGRNGRKYGCNLSIDTLSGKIMQAVVFAVPDPDRAPVRTEGEWTFYDNFDDIFPEDVTVGRFCSLLTEYWGFSGYRLSGRSGIGEETPLKDLPSDTRPGSFLMVYFEGDQQGAPRYVELAQYAGHVALNVGTGHSVG